MSYYGDGKGIDSAAALLALVITGEDYPLFCSPPCEGIGSAPGIFDPILNKIDGSLLSHLPYLGNFDASTLNLDIIFLFGNSSPGIPIPVETSYTTTFLLKHLVDDDAAPSKYFFLRLSTLP